MWEVATTDVFDEWFTGLTEDEQVAIDAVVTLLKGEGPHLRRPHADTLSGSRHSNMKELRAATATAVLRVAFAFDPARSAILLVGGDKAGVSQRRFYRQLIDRADVLLDAHLAALRSQAKKKGD